MRLLLVLSLAAAATGFLQPPPAINTRSRHTQQQRAGLPSMQAAPRGGGKSLVDSLFGGAASKPTAGAGGRRKEGQGAAVVKKYFELWNERRMSEAVELFSPDCVYEDTLYPGAFEGRDNLRKHLFKVADALPDSFAFVVDVISDGGDGNVGVQWHVESEGKQLPFTRGSSMYKVDARSGQITYGFDVPEPTVKSGSFSLAILTVAGKLIDSPKRALPLAAWAFYCWFVFLSTVAPGPNALSLDPATWQEVRDLSLNFWLIMPIGFPDASPVLHPGLEGLFNFLLSWAALFSGFIVDGKRESIGDYQLQEQQDGEDGGKGPKNAFVPYVLGMQLLTNAIYLPYLVLRKPWFPNESGSSSVALTGAERFGESRVAPLAFMGVGLLSLGWAALGRPEFGDLATRWASFVDIVGTDRLTFSFVIDCLYFWAFQGWLMDDDLQRRPQPQSGGPNLAVAKAVPFFGLVYYLLARPRLQLDGGEEA